MASFMVKTKDGKIGKTNNKPNAVGKCQVFIQNPLEPNGNQPKFEFTKMPTLLSSKDYTILGTID